MPCAKSRPPLRPLPPKDEAPEVVDPVWLLKALGLCVVAALVCGYATLCLLFYQGEWQFVLHPSPIGDQTPAQIGLAFSSVHFDASETGQPRLTGWWVPAAGVPGQADRLAAYTVLYLHDGSGSLSNTVPALARLHAMGINVFAIDYRGFGASDSSAHPSAETMSQDSTASLDYLVATRHIPVASIIPYGVGLAASLAADLAKAHPELRAIILDNPDPDPASKAVAQRPIRLIPVRLLFGRQFDVSRAIQSLKTPKLIIFGGPSVDRSEKGMAADESLFKNASPPIFGVTLPSGGSDGEYQAGLDRFLDRYLR